MKKSVITLVMVVLVVAGLLFTALHGISYTKTTTDKGNTNETASGEAATDNTATKTEKVDIIQSVSDGVVLGLDLVGGSEITYEAVVPDSLSAEELSEGMEVARTMLKKRLDTLGYTEANCYISGERRLVVEIPSVENPEQAVAQLGKTAVVSFMDADGTVWLTGSDVDNAEYEFSPTDNTGMNRPHVRLDLNSEGQSKLSQASSAIISRKDGQNFLAIYLDDEKISDPRVSSKLNTDSVVITFGAAPPAGFNSTEEYARYLADIISAGRLPFELTTAKQQTIGASLGEKSLSTSLVAGLIGLILVMIFMIAVYRLMGLISCVALVTYAALFGVAISLFHVNLSLPGIAGIILTVGMAVDANVIIFERIKEELRLGKTLRFAIESGYKRALLAIIDANVTTMIAGFVLLWQGSGTILGFATTLLIGVALSMLVMLVLTKILLKTAVGLKITNLKLYCA